MAAGRAELRRPQVLGVLVARAKLSTNVPGGEQTGLALKPVVHKSEPLPRRRGSGLEGGLHIGGSQLGFSLRGLGSGRIVIRQGEVWGAINHHTGRKQLVRKNFHGYYLSASMTAPTTTNEPPTHCCHPTFSCSRTAAKRMANTTLNLSTGAPREASPSWSARK